MAASLKDYVIYKLIGVTMLATHISGVTMLATHISGVTVLATHISVHTVYILRRPCLMNAMGQYSI